MAKMKPAIVPVKKLSQHEFQELSRLAQDTQAQVPKMTPATVPNSYLSLLGRQKKAQLADKKRKKKFRIYRLVLVKELRATEEEAQQEMDRLSARYNPYYWLDEVPPRRPPPIRVK
jgi:hypothetical protein